ncbi:unnamed protein product [Trifolium pratense]|uniref:Uncharacterized protein n=1 Tax=Trifolium pratense TaxID=57577 RepID=A0ACB0KP51_TRIPR|nr:unnamed protein product [Trifolium pratense]
MKGNAPMKGIYTIFEDPVYCNGYLYAGMETFFGFIIVVIEKLQPNGFSINCTHDPMLKHEPSSHACEEVISCSIGSNNVLFRITILHAQNKVTAVFVYKFDCSQRVWEKVENIKDKVFFISSLDPAFACQTINPEIEGGRIYIALRNCNYFYIYNIEEKSIATSPPFSNLPENLCNVVYLMDGGDKVHKYALPLDVVEVIAKHIKNVLDYLQFRASNKLFRLSAPQIQWRSYSSMSMSRFNDISMCPLFVFSEKNSVFTFVHPKHGLDYKNFINFPQGERWNLDSEICCSKEGWLFLVAVNTGFQVFFNPFTKEVLPLPLENKVIWNIRCFGMSDSPTSSECVIVELVYKDLSFISKPIATSYINFLERDYINLTFESRKFPPYNTNPAFHNGSFYFLSITGKLAVIEVIRGNIRWKVLEGLQSPCSTCFNNFLVECVLGHHEGAAGDHPHWA